MRSLQSEGHRDACRGNVRSDHDVGTLAGAGNHEEGDAQQDLAAVIPMAGCGGA